MVRNEVHLEVVLIELRKLPIKLLSCAACTSDVAKEVIIEDNAVTIRGKPCYVKWTDAEHHDCSGKIKSVEEKQGQSAARDVHEFENGTCVLAAIDADAGLVACVDMQIHMCVCGNVNICVDVSAGMFVDKCTDRCVDMCIDMRLPVITKYRSES